MIRLNTLLTLLTIFTLINISTAQGTQYTYPAGEFSPVENIMAISDGSVVGFYDTSFNLVDELAVLNSPATGQRHITNLRWSPDGKKLIFTIYDILTENATTTGILLEVWEYTINDIWEKKSTIPDLMVTDIVWSPDSRFFAVSDIDTLGYPTTIRMYNSDTGNEEKYWSGDDPRISQLAWHPNGNQIASSGRDVVLWDVSVNPVQHLTTLSNASTSLGLSYSPDGSKVGVSGSSTTDISIYDTNSYNLLNVINDNAIELAHFSWESNIIIGVGFFESVQLWDTITGQSILTIPINVDERISKLTFNLDMSQILIFSRDEGIHTRDAQTGDILATLSGGATGSDLITNITHFQGHTYTHDNDLQVNDLVYEDRSYTFTEVDAELLGVEFIQTLNNDKLDNDPATLSFTLSEEATVYVGYDSRHSAPTWLSGWQLTGYTLVSTDSSGTLARNVYAKTYPAGQVTLGGTACPVSECVTYTVLAEPGAYTLPVTCDYDIAASDTTALIQAINDAKANPGAAVICLANSTYAFTSVAEWSQGPNALPNITDEITIVGNGATLTRDSSLSDARVARVTSGGTLTVENVIFDDWDTYDSGGVFYVEGTLSLTDSTLRNSSGEQGGALYSTSGGTLTIADSTFESNSAGDEGADVFNEGGIIEQ